MKILNRKSKAILLLIGFLFFVVVMGSCGVMLFVDYQDIYAILFFVGFIGYSIFLILIECFSKDYQLKYYFLGKNFRAQKNAYFLTHTSLTKQEKRDIIKNMKNEYRRHGNVSVTVFCITDTPNKLWTDENYAFSYPNARDEEKINYIIGQLYLYCETGGGFYRFFDTLASEPFDFNEFSTLVKNYPLFSKELKSALTTKKHKEVLNAFKGEVMTEKESALLEEFDENESHLLFDHQTELFNLVEKLSIEFYLNLKQKENLPDNTVMAFISKDKTKRIAIYLDLKTNTYKINRSTFSFYDLDCSPMLSEGSWSFGENSSHFADISLALNDIQKEIEDFDKLEI